MRVPALPKVVQGAGGAIRVRVVKGPLTCEGVTCLGLYDSEKRVIQVVKGLPPLHRWKVYYHELVHAALMDAGLDNGLPEALHESIADAISTSRVREHFGNTA